MVYSSYEEAHITMQTRLRILQILLILCIFQKGKFSNRENNRLLKPNNSSIIVVIECVHFKIEVLNDNNIPIFILIKS